MSSIWRVLCLTFIVLSCYTNSSLTKNRGFSESDEQRLEILNIYLSNYLENLEPTERTSDDATEVERVVQFLQNFEKEEEPEPEEPPINDLWTGLSILSEFLTKLLTSPSLMSNMVQPAVRMMDSAFASTADDQTHCTCPPVTCPNLEPYQQLQPQPTTLQPRTSLLVENTNDVVFACSRLQPVSKLNPYMLTGTWAMPSLLLYSERLTLDNSTESATIKSGIKRLDRPSMQSALCLRTEVIVHSLHECEFTVDIYALGTKIESMKYNWHSPTGNGRMNYTYVYGMENKMVDEVVVLDVNPDEYIAVAACSGGIAVGGVILTRKNKLPASHEFIWDNILRQIGNHPSDQKRIWNNLGTKCVSQ